MLTLEYNPIQLRGPLQHNSYIYGACIVYIGICALNTQSSKMFKENRYKLTKQAQNYNTKRQIAPSEHKNK